MENEPHLFHPHLLLCVCAFFLEYRCPFSSVQSLSKIAIPQNTCANRAGAQILSVKEIYGVLWSCAGFLLSSRSGSGLLCWCLSVSQGLPALRGRVSAECGVCCWAQCQLRGDTAKPGPCFLFSSQRAGSLWSEPQVSSVHRQEQTWSHTRSENHVYSMYENGCWNRP